MVNNVNHDVSNYISFMVRDDWAIAGDCSVSMFATWRRKMKKIPSDLCDAGIIWEWNDSSWAEVLFKKTWIPGCALLKEDGTAASCGCCCTAGFVALFSTEHCLFWIRWIAIWGSLSWLVSLQPLESLPVSLLGSSPYYCLIVGAQPGGHEVRNPGLASSSLTIDVFQKWLNSVPFYSC